MAWLGEFPNADGEKPAVRQSVKITLLPCDRTIEGTCVDRAGQPLAKVHVGVTSLRTAPQTRTLS